MRDGVARKRSFGVSVRQAGRGVVGDGLARFIDDDDAADHRVVADAAELVADDAEVAGGGGRDAQAIVIARNDLEVDAQREEREAVVHVERRQVQHVLLALLQLQDGVPLEGQAHQVDVGARRRRGDGECRDPRRPCTARRRPRCARRTPLGSTRRRTPEISEILIENIIIL